MTIHSALPDEMSTDQRRETAKKLTSRLCLTTATIGDSLADAAHCLIKAYYLKSTDAYGLWKRRPPDVILVANIYKALRCFERNTPNVGNLKPMSGLLTSGQVFVEREVTKDSPKVYSESMLKERRAVSIARRRVRKGQANQAKELKNRLERTAGQLYEGLAVAQATQKETNLPTQRDFLAAMETTAILEYFGVRLRTPAMDGLAHWSLRPMHGEMKAQRSVASRDFANCRRLMAERIGHAVIHQISSSSEVSQSTRIIVDKQGLSQT